MADKYLSYNGLSYFWGKLKTLINGKVDKVNGKGLSANDFTDTLKNKLDGIAENATRVLVDSSMSSTSTNPVQNKVVNTALGGKVDKVDGKGLSTNDYTTAEKNKLSEFQQASNYALKTEISGVYKYKGSVETYDDLPTTGNVLGDVYNVEETDMNYAWNGTAWDQLGSGFAIDAITNAEIDTIMA